MAQLVQKIYQFIKTKVRSYLPKQFREYVVKVEEFLEELFGQDKAKDFLKTAKRDQRKVGKNLYAEAHVLDFLGIDADVKPKMIRKKIEQQLQTIKFLGKKVRVHPFFAKKLEDIETKVSKAVKQSGYKLEEIRSYAWKISIKDKGKSGPKQLDKRSFGLAIDIDSKRNPYRSYGEVEAMGEIGKHMETVEIFTNAGISWGGNWQNIQAPMRFELTYEDLLKIKT